MAKRFPSRMPITLRQRQPGSRTRLALRNRTCRRASVSGEVKERETGITDEKVSRNSETIFQCRRSAGLHGTGSALVPLVFADCRNRDRWDRIVIHLATRRSDEVGGRFSHSRDRSMARDKSGVSYGDFVEGRSGTTGRNIEPYALCTPAKSV